MILKSIMLIGHSRLGAKFPCKIFAMYRMKNQTTQPVTEFPVFNNWGVVANGWYFAMASSELKSMEVKPLFLCGQELVLFRGKDGRVSALDAYCPHMGTHLGKGKVVDNQIRCFFHHWQFDGKGNCIHIPCQKEIPERSIIPSYTVLERYESIWVYPSSHPPHELSDFQELSHEVPKMISFGKSYERSCHHHVTMMNGIDPQHLKTVHDLDIEMSVDIRENEKVNRMDITLTGKIGMGNWREKCARFFLGEQYSYAMRYDHGNNGFLTLMKDVYFKSWKWPTLHMIFAYRPLEKGRLFVQPIYITKKRSGIFGTIVSKTLLWLTKRAFYSLQGEDGEVYENMRFYPGALLPIDRPVAQYIQYVNKLKLSPWKLP
jgi:phenylpropionate dioxygenase-like ring-hydroxylating dioxygenase large terminal subunit